MAERSENVIGWNTPNVVTILFMLTLLWIGFGFVSHMIRGKTAPNSGGGVSSDQAGNIQFSPDVTQLSVVA
jgi:hypothetical protein